MPGLGLGLNALPWERPSPQQTQRQGPQPQTLGRAAVNALRQGSQTIRPQQWQSQAPRQQFPRGNTLGFPRTRIGQANALQERDPFLDSYEARYYNPPTHTGPGTDWNWWAGEQARMRQMNEAQQQPTFQQADEIAPLPDISRIPDIAPIDSGPAAQAAYARAKDQAGAHGRAALDSLMELQGGRGIVGSGVGVNEAAGIISEGARQLGDVNREQILQALENERWRVGQNYQGGIAQRGQDYGGRGQELERRRLNSRRRY